MVCVTTVFTLQRARACVRLFFYTAAQAVYLHTVKRAQTRAQTSAGNKGCRCGRLIPPPPPLPVFLCEGARGEMERLNLAVWWDATGLHYLYLLICLALS